MKYLPPKFQHHHQPFSARANPLAAGITSLWHPEATALRILQRTRHSTADFDFPVDPAIIAQNLGVKVFASELPKSVIVALVKKVPGEPTILLNSRYHLNRQRLACAHALGHYLQVASPTSNADYECIDWHHQTLARTPNPAEIYATNFAANLLMPSHEVALRYQKGMRAAELAIDFRVPVEAAQIRLQDLFCD